MAIAELLEQSILVLPSYLIDANKRIFSVYLISAVVLAIPAYLLYSRKVASARTIEKSNSQDKISKSSTSKSTSTRFTFGALFAYLFNQKIWLHDSAKLDYGLFIVNRILRALLWAPIILTMVPIAIGLSDLFEKIFGTIEPITTNSVVIMGSFTLILFLLDDMSRFLLHLAMHKIPFLWDFHKVHHSAKVLTPMTIYRSHPFESYLYACRMAISQGIAVGISYYLFGPTLTMFDVLGANVFVFVFNLMGSNLRHSHVKWSWGNKIENWFISPLQHQIHHSDNPVHFDRNLGSALAIWDKCCGTLIKSSEVGRIRFGIGKDTGHKTLLQAYLNPFKDNMTRIRQLKLPMCFRRVKKET